MATLREATDLLGNVRQKNPGLDSLNDQELADLLYEKTGNESLKPVQESSALLRGVNAVTAPFSHAGQGVEEGLTQFLGGDQSLMARVAGKTAGNLVSSAPELGVNMLAGAFKGVPRYLGFGTGAALSYGRTKAETGSDTAALGSAASSLLSLAGGIKGAEYGRSKMGGKGLKGMVGGTVGSAIGSIPGDALGIATSPGGLADFISDPANPLSYLAGQTIVSAAIDHVVEGTSNRIAKREEVRNNIPDYTDTLHKTDQQEYADLLKKPSSEKTEIDLAREKDLTSRLTSMEDRISKLKEQKNKQYDPTDFSTVPETTATLQSQLYLVSKGKKAVMEIPKGSNPNLDDTTMPGYMSYTSPTNGNLYLYNEGMTSPPVIEGAIQANSLGMLLGYGTPTKPVKPSGFAAVLRDKRGTEKAAVVLGDNNERAVLKSLGDMAIGDDVISTEKNEDVIKWRVRNDGLQKLQSLFTPMDDGQNELSFTNHVLDMFNKSMEAKGSKGPRFQTDANAEISAKGLVQAVKDWSPSALWEHYKDRGIETLLKSDKVEPVYMYTVYGPEYGPKAAGYTQIDELIHQGRGDPLSDEFKATLPKPPADSPTGQYIQKNGKWEVIPKGTDYDALHAQYSKPTGKIKAAEFTKWIRENTPEIETKKLLPGPSAQENLGQFEHRLETEGYTPIYDDNGNITHYQTREGKKVLHDDLPSPALELAEELHRAIDSDRMGHHPIGDSDAATGRYNVEPKPLDKMPRAVDILGRVPVKQIPEIKPRKGPAGEQYTGVPAREEVLFKGPHFGDSDKNVLFSARGHEEILTAEHATRISGASAGDKVFHAFEIQGDWAQRLAQEKKKIESRREQREAALSTLTPEQRENMGKDSPKTSQHPLLEHYESLAVKAIIQHAREIGAKYIAISDAPTAMMTEGHDQIRMDGVSPGGPGGTYIIPQEKGMRAAYDQRLPAIAEKLTRSKGQRVDFGEHKSVYEGRGPDQTQDRKVGSPILRENGKPKTNITARLYDISNPSPEVRKLFSLYDADKQTSLENTLRLERTKRYGRKKMTEEEILNSVVGGKREDVEPLLNFLDAIKGERGIITQGRFSDPGLVGEISLDTRDIKLSVEHIKTLSDAVTKLSHELTHGAIDDVRLNDPEAYTAFISSSNDLGAGNRLAIFSEIKRKLGLGEQFDPEYLAGTKFDKADPRYKEKVAHEFAAGLMEASAEHYRINNQSPDWYKYLPMPLVRVMQAFTKSIKKYFGSDYPSISHMLLPEAGKRVSDFANLMSKHVSKLADDNLQAVLGLNRTSRFDEGNFVSNLPTFRKDMGGSLPKGGGGELHSFAGDLFKKAMGVGQSKYEDYFYSALFRTRDQPYTAEHFWNLHNFRPNTQSEVYEHLSSIGQNEAGDLSRQQALERYGKFVKEVANPSNPRGQKWLETSSKIFEENQNIRERLSSSKRDVTDADLVQVKDMISKYGMTPEEATFFEGFRKLPERVAAEQHRKQEATDNYQIAKVFFRANKKQNAEGVSQKVERLGQMANEFGSKRYELDVYKKRLDLENRQPNPDLELQGVLEQNVNQLQAEQEQFSLMFDQAIRQEFTGAIPIQPGPDNFISSVGEAMVRMAALRAQSKFITKDAGYAPMTRRGRFLLRVYEKSEFGEEFAKVKEFKGFDSKKQADDYIAANQFAPADYELMDKEELRQRARIFSPDKLKGVRDRAKQQLGELIGHLSDQTLDMDPAQRESLLTAMSDLERRFQPLEEEIKDVLAVKGDKFKERRYLVPGFDRNDFLPNIVEYMDFNTVSGNKKVTRARGELHLEREELDSNPEMRKRMEDELNYTLSNQTEFNTLRKAIFYYYLGGSFRHVVQNAVQIPLNGISQMVSDGGGLSSYGHFAKGAKLAAKYGFKGTTGDQTIDILLKQAERDGISFQTALENPIHESVDLQNALDSINAQSEGTKTFGKKISYLGTQSLKAFERFMQSTSAAAEGANRKTTFIASLLKQRADGVSDMRTLYGEASKFTNYVNFVGDKPNRPGFMIKSGGTIWHGPVSVLSAMQSFTLNHISQLYSFWKKGFQQGSSNDKKAFYTGMAHLLAFSGSMGMIGAATAEAVFEEMTGISLKRAMREGMVTAMTSLSDDEEDKTGLANFADRVSDGVLGGIPNIFGVDASNSIGLGSPLIRYQAGQPITAEQFGGPAAGMIGRVVDGIGEIKADPFNPQQWWSATRSAAPAFLSQALRVFDVLSKGTVVDKNQQPVSDPLGISGSVATLAGFTPTQVSKQRQFNSEIYKSNKKSADEYQRVVRNISKHLDDFYTGGDEEALLKANQMFSDYLSSVSGLQDRSEFVQAITDQLEEFEGRVTKPASLKGSAERQRLEKTFPSVKSRVPAKTSSLLKSLEVALSLGQDDLLSQKLESLPSSLQSSILNDALTQAGLRPEAAGLIQSPGRVGHLGPNLDLSALSGR